MQLADPPLRAPPPPPPLSLHAEIWLNNIRYAMLDVLRHPRPGYEEVIATHFRWWWWGGGGGGGGGG